MTNYTPCPVFDNYIPLWLVFAGDRALLDEIMEHKMSCPVCLANIHEAPEVNNEIPS